MTAESEAYEIIHWNKMYILDLNTLQIDYDDDLGNKPELQRTTEQLWVDYLIVRMRPETVIQKQIAEIFRLDNILDYKDTEVPLSENEFHKSLGCFHLYMSENEDVEITDMTLSIVVTAYPRELFKYLDETLCCSVDERYPGVFVVTGYMVPIQILHTEKLSEEENLWLWNLNRNLTKYLN